MSPSAELNRCEESEVTCAYALQVLPASEAAAAEAELRHFLEAGFGKAEGIFLKHVLADDAELAHAVGDEGRDVVVAHQHEVHGEILGARAQGRLAAARQAQARALEQGERFVAEAPRLLDGEVDTASVGAHSGRSIRSRRRR